jgi:ATP-dependent RNA helicase RhlE
MTEFSELGLSPEILQAISNTGYTTATPIQAEAIPVALTGRDVLGIAQTGTGKTAAFTLPMIERLASGRSRARMPRALVIAPTRELADQVSAAFERYSAGQVRKLSWALLIGGVSFSDQELKLDRGVDVLVATPGRLLDHFERGKLLLTGVQILVVDEADRMLDMGFIHDIRRVLKLLPQKRQNLLFSATYSSEIRELADGILRDPAVVEVARRNTAAETVTQVIHPVAKADKRFLLAKLIKEGDWHQVLVFTRTKHGANRLAEQLGNDGIPSAAIHGNKSQSARTKALADFKSNAIRVLVATDVASRGIDIRLLPHVVNFELPNVPEDYVHRIGRTGRAGEEGCACSLVSADERGLLKDIEKVLKRSIPVQNIPGFAMAEVDGLEDARNTSRGNQNRGGRGRGSGGGQSGRSGNGGGPGRNSRRPGFARR